VELSGMRDCGGVSETLDELEPAPLPFKSSILAGRYGGCGVKCGVSVAVQMLRRLQPWDGP
jgi:hypothetical protein